MSRRVSIKLPKLQPPALEVGLGMTGPGQWRKHTTQDAATYDSMCQKRAKAIQDWIGG